MIRIDVNSWHARVAALVQYGWSRSYRNPHLNLYCESLCTYFWTVAFGVCILIPALVLLSPFIFAWHAITVVFDFLWRNGGETMVSTSIAAVADAVVEWFDARAERRRQRGGISKINLFVEWLKAKKDKVCPRIQFYDSIREEEERASQGRLQAVLEAEAAAERAALADETARQQDKLEAEAVAQQELQREIDKPREA